MLSGYRDTMIHCRKHFEMHQHEMHNICITTNMSSIHFATMRVYEFYLWGHVGATWAHESWRQCPMATANTGAADITHAYPSHQGDCGQIGDNPQIQLSGVKWPSAGVTECRHFPGLQGVTLVKSENVWHRVTLIMWPIIWCPGHTQGSPVTTLHAVRHTSWHCAECCRCQYIIIMSQLKEWGGDNDKTFFPLLMEMLSTYWIILTQQRMTVCLPLIAIHCTARDGSSWIMSGLFLRVGTFPLLICFSFTLLSPLDLLWVQSSSSDWSVTSSAALNPFLLNTEYGIHLWSNCDGWAWVQRKSVPV